MQGLLVPGPAGVQDTLSLPASVGVKTMSLTGPGAMKHQVYCRETDNSDIQETHNEMIAMYIQGTETLCDWNGAVHTGLQSKPEGSLP